PHTITPTPADSIADYPHASHRSAAESRASDDSRSWRKTHPKYAASRPGLPLGSEDKSSESNLFLKIGS
ncbi:MAG: hypothetical protein ACRD1J_11490, partial [Terriglobia bacterium]